MFFLPLKPRQDGPWEVDWQVEQKNGLFGELILVLYFCFENTQMTPFTQRKIWYKDGK